MESRRNIHFNAAFTAQTQSHITLGQSFNLQTKQTFLIIDYFAGICEIQQKVGNYKQKFSGC